MLLMNRCSLILIVLGLFLIGITGCSLDDPPNSPEEPDNTGEVVEDPVWEVRIERAEDVLQGHYIGIDLTVDLDSVLIGGFDLLIAYDGYAMAFTGAELGSWLKDCGWEYFTYRTGPNFNCGNNCPSGLIRLVGMAETNNGAVHPDFDCILEAGQGTIATMTFLVSNDRQYECSLLPIQFYWSDCGDNTMATTTGDTLAINRHVYDANDSLIEDYESEFFSYTGAPDSCLEGAKYQPIRYIDFYNGYLDIICSDTIDGRGDINLNGIAFEIADAVVFSNFFILGTDAFGSHVEGSTAASDTNRDGLNLTVADLVYLIRVINGDAIPSPPPPGTAKVYYKNGLIETESQTELGRGLVCLPDRGRYRRPGFTDRRYGYDIRYSRQRTARAGL